MEKWWDNPTAAVGALMGEKAQATAEYQITKKLQAEYERGYEDGVKATESATVCSEDGCRIIYSEDEE